jgi:hypothetical protein
MLITGKSSTLFGPGFILMLALMIWIVYLIIQSEVRSGRSVAMVKARSDERFISTLLQTQASKAGGLANLDQQFIFSAVFADKRSSIWFSTNTAGELLDVWRTPYQIELTGQTNFVIRSAGPNRHFGDEDDIVFNSISNAFVKP